MKGNLSKLKEEISQIYHLKANSAIVPEVGTTWWLIGEPFLTQPTWQHKHAALTHLAITP